jgi:hypothetical protein
MKITWPSPQDYNEAVQNPRLCFLDDELKGAQPELNQLGLPKPSTGNFATVYRLNSKSRSWAVRCFVQAAHDHELRYQQISRHLGQKSIPETVGFEYLPNGIQVKARRFPLLKMEWVDGVPLDNFVRCHRENQAVMRAVAQRFVRACLSLMANGIAHGDLQHGNIMICANDLRLIDYDGMYVPQLSGAPASEMGHRHYQHPLRNGTHFGQYLDNFSSWVIFISLFSLAQDPTLWDVLDAGDECLLFRNPDFLAPHQSKVFAVLRQHEQAGIRNLAEYFLSLTQLSPERIPPVNAGLLGVEDLTGMNLTKEVEICKQATPSMLWEEREREVEPVLSGTRGFAGGTTFRGGNRPTSNSGNFFRSAVGKGDANPTYTNAGNLPWNDLLERASNAFTSVKFDEA